MLMGACLFGVLLVSACGTPEPTPTTTAPSTTFSPTTTGTTLPPTTTTTLPPTPTTTLPPTTTTTNTTVPFLERLRPDIAALNILVACLEEYVAEMDVAALLSAIASELAVYNRAQLNSDIRFFELDAGFLRCLPELPVYASARVELEEALDGVLDYADDVDVFVFQATENGLYEISVDLGTLSDSLVTVYDKDEIELARNDDREGSLASHLLWRAPATGGDFYVVVEGYGAGSYTLTVVLSDIVDDHPDEVGSEVSRVGAGEALDGVLDYADDVDVFVFETVAGELYEIGVDLGTLSDSIVRVYDSDGVELGWNDDHEGSLASHLLWRAPATGGEFYVVVDGYGAGSYTVTVELSDIVDDHPDKVEGAVRLEMRDPVDAELEYPDDVDVFVLETIAGELYEIGVDLGTLSDSIVRVYDSDGVELGWNDDHGDSLASHLVWEAPTTAAYYVEVSGYGAGSYTLTVQPTD